MSIKIDILFEHT